MVGLGGGIGLARAYMDMGIDGLLTVFFCLSVFWAANFFPSWFGAYGEESDILCACF